MKTSISLLVALAFGLALSACSSTGDSPQMTTAPSGANGTTHGAPKSGQPSGPGSGTSEMRR